jgi:uncharacterized membrane protein
MKLTPYLFSDQGFGKRFLAVSCFYRKFLVLTLT